MCIEFFLTEKLSNVGGSGQMPSSGNVLIDAIAGIGWLGRGGDRNITFFFDNSFGFHNWTAGEKDAFQAALQQYANVANITIQQVGSSAGADLSERWVSDAYMQANFGDFVITIPRRRPPRSARTISTAAHTSRPAGLPPAVRLPGVPARDRTRAGSCAHA